MGNSLSTGVGAPDRVDFAHLSTGQAYTNLLWFALYARARHEKAVEESLKGKGYSAFSPCYRARRRRADRTVDLDLPLFPSYVFCQFDPSRRLPILQTPGVVFILGGENGPEPVDHREIDAIQAIVTSGRPVQPGAFLRTGQKIRVRAGALAGTEGTFLRVKNQDYLIASITLLQRSVAVQIEQELVEPVY